MTLHVIDPKPVIAPTEGPWELNKFGNSIYTRDHQMIATTVGITDQDKVNARLLAQAPAMYELLQDLRDLYQHLLLSEDFHARSGGEVSHRVNTILTAIEGGQ